MIAHGRWRNRRFKLGFFREEVDRFFADLCVNRRFLFKARQQFPHGARIKQRAGETMLSYFARFFEHINVFLAQRPIRVLLIVLIDEL